MTNTKKKSLKYVLCIYYLVDFQKHNNDIEVLIDFDSKIIILTLIYTLILGIYIQKTDIRVYKIDRSSLVSYKKVNVVI